MREAGLGLNAAREHPGRAPPRPLTFRALAFALAQVLGMFILWVGWYGFNPGSTINIRGYTEVAAHAAVTTTISAAAGAIMTLSIVKQWQHIFSLGDAINGTLAGLVSITAGCSVIEPGVAVVVGAIGGMLFLTSAHIVRNVLRIDDVVDAFSVHFVCGAWGLIAASLFATERGVIATFGPSTPQLYGAFYAPSGHGHQFFVCALIGIATISGWTFTIMYSFFKLMSALGRLRVPEEMELLGIDVSKHGGLAYPEQIECGSASPQVHHYKATAISSARTAPTAKPSAGEAIVTAFKGE